MKKILFANGNYNDIPLVEAAHRLGCYVITSGNDPQGEAHAYSDEYVPCDYTDKEKLLAIAEEKGVDAVCSCGNDLTAIAAAYVCEKLGLPGHDSYDVSCIFHEKDQFKKLCEKLSLSTPRSVPFTVETEAQIYAASCQYPKIIKPVDLGGGKGIAVARDEKQGADAVREAFRQSKNKHIVIEDYIEGTQHGFICYIKNGKVIFDYSTNDYSYLNPFMVWMASGYPADGYEDVRDTIIGDVEKMAAATHMADGFLTIQYMMMNGKAYYIETMRRCLGNYHFKCISRDLGIDLYELFVATELGLDCSGYLERVSQTGLMSGFMGIYATENGILQNLRFDKAFEESVFDRMYLAEPGYRITHYLDEKLGMVWFSFKNEAERKSFLEKRRDLFSVNVVKEQREQEAHL